MLETSGLAILELLRPIGVANVVFLVLFVLAIGYVSYMRFLHPLSRYPGPAIASLTNAWKAYYVYKLVLHERLVELHQQYGPVVRVGPNHLHFWDGDAISTIYKGGRKMGKTEFYDAFTAFNPNLFGGTDEDVRWLYPRGILDHLLMNDRFTPCADDNWPMDFRRPRLNTLNRLLTDRYIY